jgi:cation diffusion facilitator family transporter
MGSALARAERIAIGSIAIGCLVLALKVAAWQLTGSVALYSDALESVVNVVASAIAFAAIRIAARPADENHPFGHEKAEFFAAVIEGVLIILAALSILREAWHVFLAPRAIEAVPLGLAVNGAATVLNAAWAWVLLHHGKRLRSAALTADGWHLLADVVTSVGVAIGVGLAAITGWLVLDPLLAAATAAHVLISGMRMIRDSVGGLMDAAPADHIIRRVRELVSEHAAGAIEAHDLRMRHAGRLTFLEFHLVVPGSMTVAESHEICDRIEAALENEMAFLKTTIHVEPEGKAKHRGVLVL